MTKIDRSDKEKTIKIGPWRLKMASICMIALVVIIAGSSLGYIGTSFFREDDGEPQQNFVFAQVVIGFDVNNTFSEIVSVEEGQTAAAAFGKVANITTQDTVNGKVVDYVQWGNLSKANTETESWVLYINGKIQLRGVVEEYLVKQNDVIYLKYEEKPF